MVSTVDCDSARAPVVKSWSTESAPPGDSVDLWNIALSQNFLPWTLGASPCSPFAARIDSASIDRFRLIHCVCDSNRGFRKRAEISHTDGAYFAILCVLAGREVLTIRDRQIILEAGNFVVWDSEEPMEYALLGPLEKATILVPREVLLSAIPHVRRLVGVPFNRRPGIESVFFGYVQSLILAMRTMDSDQLRSVLGATLDILARTTWSALEGPRDARLMTLIKAQKYIESRLHDPKLAPSDVAHACGVSVRYLHGLFSGAGSPVCEWMRSRRLQKCREDLLAGRHDASSISTIALRWGFSDAAHFSRLFRSAYGVSPRDFRALNSQGEF